MQRVSRSSAVPSLPAAPTGGTPGYFTGGNPALGQAATTPGYEWFNAVQEELIGLLTRAGVTPAQADLTQVRQSLDRLYGGGLATYSANATLTPGDAGVVLVDATTGPRLIILPAASAMNARPIPIRVVKIDASANAVTIQRAGSDTIEGAGTLVLAAQFECAALASNGVNTWFNASPVRASNTVRGIARFATSAEVTAGSVTDATLTPAALAGAMPKLFNINGYQVLPSGLIMQWGRTNVGDIGGGGVTSFTATFPIAFPNAVLVLLGREQSTSGYAFSVVEGSATLTGASFNLMEWSAVVQAASVHYLAIGH